MIQYEIEIRNDKKKSYRVFHWFALVISLAGFLLLLLYDNWLWEASFAILVLGGYFLYRLYLRKKNKDLPLFDDNGYFFLIIALGWAVLYKFLLAFICLVLGLIYKLAMQKISFLFQKEKVVKTNFPRQEMDWQSIDNVILKDGILTIDFKNNRIIQGDIIAHKEIDEAAFNAFARLLIINSQL